GILMFLPLSSRATHLSSASLSPASVRDEFGVAIAGPCSALPMHALHLHIVLAPPHARVAPRHCDAKVALVAASTRVICGSVHLRVGSQFACTSSSRCSIQ